MPKERRMKTRTEDEEDSDRLEIIKATHTTITIVTTIMKAIIRTTAVAKEVKVKAEAEAKEETAEAADTKANILIQTTTIGRIIIITTQIRMHRTRIRIIINSNYLLLLRNSNNNRNSNSSSNSRMVISATTEAASNEIFVGEAAQKYMSIPH